MLRSSRKRPAPNRGSTAPLVASMQRIGNSQNSCSPCNTSHNHGKDPFAFPPTESDKVGRRPSNTSHSHDKDPYAFPSTESDEGPSCGGVKDGRQKGPHNRGQSKRAQQNSRASAANIGRGAGKKRKTSIEQSKCQQEDIKSKFVKNPTDTESDGEESTKRTRKPVRKRKPSRYGATKDGTKKEEIMTRSKLNRRLSMEIQKQHTYPRKRLRVTNRQQSYAICDSDSDALVSDGHSEQDQVESENDLSRDDVKNASVAIEVEEQNGLSDNSSCSEEDRNKSDITGSELGNKTKENDDLLDEDKNGMDLGDLSFLKQPVDDDVKSQMEKIATVEDNGLGSLLKSLPGRANEIRLLLALFGESNQVTVPVLFISGPPGCGKTTVVRSVLKYLQAPHVFVDCVECHSISLLFESILNQLSGTTPSPANNYSSYSSCTNTSDFVCQCKCVIRGSIKEQTSYIVVGQAERLRSWDSSVLTTLMRLSELTGANMCVILISRVSWHAFYFDTGFPYPFTVYFPNYSIDHVGSILLLDCPSGEHVTLFKTFINLLCRVFRVACSDLNEWRHLARNLFPKFIEPVLNGKVNETDNKRLWTNIEPHFRRAMNHLLLTRVETKQGDTPFLDIPFNTKFLLIAAYLASYNPVSADKRFFSKKGDKLSKRRKLSEKSVKSKLSSQLTGPQPFPLNRLLAIFCSIVKKPSHPRSDLLQQISTLKAAGLLHLQSQNLLQKPRLKAVLVEFVISSLYFLTVFTFIVFTVLGLIRHSQSSGKECAV